MSLPWAMAPIPVAVAAPAPPLEPPGVTEGSRGLSVRPCSALSVKMRIEKAGALVRPTMMAPACFRLATTGLSSVATKSFRGTTPLSVGSPAWSTLTLVVTGTPCSGGRAWPRERAASAVSAAARASSSSTRTTALIAGLTLCRRASTESTASRAEARPVRMRRARSVASYCQSSMDAILLCRLVLDERHDVAARILHMHERAAPRLPLGRTDDGAAACLQSGMQRLDVGHAEGNSGKPPDQALRPCFGVGLLDDQERAYVEHQHGRLQRHRRQG